MISSRDIFEFYIVVRIRICRFARTWTYHRLHLVIGGQTIARRGGTRILQGHEYHTRNIIILYYSK